MNTVNSRIKFVIDKLYNGNISLFCRVAEVKQPTLNTIVGERQSKPSFDILNAIALNIKDVNLKWLITGLGNPFLDEPSVDSSNDSGRSDLLIESQQRTIENLSETVKVLSNR